MKFTWTIIDGYELRAPAGFIDSEFTETGKCGPSNGSFLELIISEKILGLKITPACKIHDYCYSIADDDSDKDTSDIEMFANSMRIMKQEGRKNKSKTKRVLHKTLCFPRTVIMTWYMLAVLFGSSNHINKGGVK